MQRLRKLVRRPWPWLALIKVRQLFHIFFCLLSPPIFANAIVNVAFLANEILPKWATQNIHNLKLDSKDFNQLFSTNGMIVQDWHFCSRSWRGRWQFTCSSQASNSSRRTHQSLSGRCSTSNGGGRKICIASKTDQSSDTDWVRGYGCLTSNRGYIVYQVFHQKLCDGRSIVGRFAH